MSTGAYAPDKALAHPDRLAQLRAGGHPFPVHLHLILSDLCNLDCPGCAYRMSGYSSSELFVVKDGTGRTVNRNPERLLERALVEQVLFDCKDMGTKAIEFTGGGEPTVHPDLGYLMRLAQNLGLDTALITNGLLLQRVGEAAIRGQWLRVSLDAATPATYAAVRPGLSGPKQTNFGRAVESIRWAVDQRELYKTDCSIGVGFVVQKGNWQEIYDAAWLAFQVGADNIRISGLFTPEGEVYHAEHREDAEELEQRAIAQFDSKVNHRGRVFRVHGRFREKLADLHARPDYPVCHYQRFTTYLGADANLYRCCVTSYNPQGLLGNVRNAGGLKALWSSDEVKQRLHRFDARSCERCQFNDRNRSIGAALLPAEPPVEPADLLHPNFV